MWADSLVRDHGDTVKPMAPVSEAAPPPAPGTIVGLDLGGTVVCAEVVEDRGDLGVGGRRIVRVAVRGDDGEVRVFEVPAEELLPPPESPSS